MQDDAHEGRRWRSRSATVKGIERGVSPSHLGYCTIDP